VHADKNRPLFAPQHQAQFGLNPALPGYLSEPPVSPWDAAEMDHSVLLTAAGSAWLSGRHKLSSKNEEAAFDQGLS